MRNKLEKFGSFGAIIAAAACPICFPKLALLGALFGLGALANFETGFFFGAQVLVVLAVIGHVVSYMKHKNWKLLSLAIISALLLFISLYAYVSEILSYLAFGGLIIATIWLIYENRRCSSCATTFE
ncbi:MerC family mercury resistance protein [Kaarinaea lacus]